MAYQKRREGESFDSMFKKFKRGVKKEGILPQLREKEFFEKPSEKRKKERKSAQQRTRSQQKADELF